jgi:hypothetical protein
MVCPELPRPSTLACPRGHAAKRSRENRTLPVDFQDETPYFQLLGNGTACVALVRAFILSLGFQSYGVLQRAIAQLEPS